MTQTPNYVVTITFIPSLRGKAVVAPGLTIQDRMFVAIITFSQNITEAPAVDPTTIIQAERCVAMVSCKQNHLVIVAVALLDITLQHTSVVFMTFTERSTRLIPVAVVHVFTILDLKYDAVTTFWRDRREHLAVARLTTTPQPIFVVVISCS